MDQDFSQSALLNFLREESVSGRLHPATARSWRKATEALFPFLNEQEQQDLRALSLGDLMQRIHDAQERDLRDELVELYTTRLRAALDVFLGDSGGAEPGFRSVAAVQTHPDSSVSASEASALEAVSLAFDRQRADVVPIPLDHGRVVYLHGLPRDLSSRDAQRIVRVVEAYVNDESPS